MKLIELLQAGIMFLVQIQTIDLKEKETRVQSEVAVGIPNFFEERIKIVEGCRLDLGQKALASLNYSPVNGNFAQGNIRPDEAIVYNGINAR